MTRAYDRSYLDDAMSNVGAMLDYAVNTCGEPLDLFWSRFLASGIARSFSQANPRYLAGMSGTELARAVAVRTGDALSDSTAFIDIGSPEYWTGWSMAYVAWYLNLDFGTLASRGVTASELRKRYSTLHEADLTKTVHFVEKCLHTSAPQNNPLKRIRESAGLTQQDLSDLSGNTLRSIRGYEQGQRSLDKASVETVLRFCRALGCQVEDLLH